MKKSATPFRLSAHRFSSVCRFIHYLQYYSLAFTCYLFFQNGLNTSKTASTLVLVVFNSYTDSLLQKAKVNNGLLLLFNNDEISRLIKKLSDFPAECSCSLCRMQSADNISFLKCVWGEHYLSEIIFNVLIKITYCYETILET